MTFSKQYDTSFSYLRLWIGLDDFFIAVSARLSCSGCWGPSVALSSRYLTPASPALQNLYATYLPSPLLCCHSWTFTRWCSSQAGPGVPQAQARPSLHSVITYIHSPLFSCPLGTWPIFSGHNIHMNVLPSSSCLLDLNWCFIWHWQKRAMSCLVCLFRPTPSKVNKSK